MKVITLTSYMIFPADFILYLQLPYLWLSLDLLFEWTPLGLLVIYSVNASNFRIKGWNKHNRRIDSGVLFFLKSRAETELFCYYKNKWISKRWLIITKNEKTVITAPTKKGTRQKSAWLQWLQRRSGLMTLVSARY